jgi:two-component system CheB/CheR fusion protein
LLSNALKYSSNERIPAIHFETNCIDNKITLSVSDNGMGIDLKKFGNKVFGLNQTFHRGIDSKGIGLFMTKSQVEAMGGTIFVESEVNKGSKFTITFNE